MMRGRFAQEDGFVTLELRIVLVLIGLVLLVPITSFAAMRQGGSDSTARSNLRAAAVVVEAHQLEYGTYEGLTPAALERSDRPRPEHPRYALSDLSETTYCISSTVRGHSWMKAGPRGAVVKGTCS